MFSFVNACIRIISSTFWNGLKTTGMVNSIKKLFIGKAVALTAIIFLVTACHGSAQQKKAIFIIADGIPADVIERLNTPALDSIAKVGGYARAYVGGEKGGYSETPTISAVGYNSLITSTWVNKHNVWDNDIVAPNYSYYNIFRLLKNQYPQKKSAVFSTWLDNRTKLVGSDAKAAGNVQPDYYLDGLELDTVHYPHDTLGYFYHSIDEVVTDTAVAYIKTKAPDLTWVYLEYTDEMGHRNGDSKQMDDAVVKMDKQVQKIWQAIQYRQKQFNEDWVIYITTDHGREKSGYHHGGQTERERTTWIVTNAQGLNKRFTKEHPAIVDIMPSIASFLGVEIPMDQAMELDGVPLTGKISATNAKASISNGIIDLSWDVMDKTGSAKIWITTTNLFKEGGKDKYTLVKEVPVANGKATIDVKNIPSDFYKIAIGLPYNFLNRWVIVKK
jgi:hypothetical protein